MTIVKLTRVPPSTVLGLAVVAFGSWIMFDATKAPRDARAEARRADSDGEVLAPNGPLPHASLAGLHVGMPRAVAEHHLSSLTPLSSDEEDLSSGASMVQSRYQVELTAPIPHLMPGVAMHAFRPGAHTLTLTFDTQSPGQPLVKVEVTPQPD